MFLEACGPRGKGGFLSYLLYALSHAPSALYADPNALCGVQR